MKAFIGGDRIVHVQPESIAEQMAIELMFREIEKCQCWHNNVTPVFFEAFKENKHD